MSDQLHCLFSEITNLAEKIFDINDEYPEMVSVCIFPDSAGCFQCFLSYSQDVVNNKAVYLDFPSWLDEKVRKSFSERELVTSSKDLHIALEQLRDHLKVILANKPKPVIAKEDVAVLLQEVLVKLVSVEHRLSELQNIKKVNN